MPFLFFWPAMSGAAVGFVASAENMGPCGEEIRSHLPVNSRGAVEW